MNKMKKCFTDNLHGKIQKEKPPIFNGEVKYGQDIEASLPGMKKYFEVHDYSQNMKARVAIFNLNGRASQAS